MNDLTLPLIPKYTPPHYCIPNYDAQEATNYKRLITLANKKKMSKLATLELYQCSELITLAIQNAIEDKESMSTWLKDHTFYHYSIPWNTLSTGQIKTLLAVCFGAVLSFIHTEMPNNFYRAIDHIPWFLSEPKMWDLDQIKEDHALRRVSPRIVRTIRAGVRLLLNSYEKQESLFKTSELNAEKIRTYPTDKTCYVQICQNHGKIQQILDSTPNEQTEILIQVVRRRKHSDGQIHYHLRHASTNTNYRPRKRAIRAIRLTQRYLNLIEGAAWALNGLHQAKNPQHHDRMHWHRSLIKKQGHILSRGVNPTC